MRGLCHGLVADGKINQREAESLHAWLIAQRKFANSSARVLQKRLEEMLEDEKLDKNESLELLELVRNIIFEYPEIDSNKKIFPNQSFASDHHISMLLGLCRGLLADGKITPDESRLLHDWLVLLKDSVDNPCYIALRECLQTCSGETEVTENNQTQLLQLLSGIVGGRTDAGECLRSSELWLDAPPPKVIFDKHVFCLTGKFVYGSRKECETAVQERGGICRATPSKKINYLVIGSYAEDSWIQSSFGRKIEKAVQLRAAGADLRIISESHWTSSLDTI